jgi:DNA-binding NtrC family response regulator
MVMPEMDGAALFQALQIQNPEIKVLLTTGYPLSMDALEIMAQDKEEWLEKPLTMAQLAQVVSRALQ